MRPHRTTLRDNLESIAMAVLLVLVVRQLVVEAFKIPTGSMAPALLGVHKEVRCPNCGWIFMVGHDPPKRDERILTGECIVVCPNCDERFRGASSFCEDSTGWWEFRWPGWLWHKGYSRQCHAEVVGSDAANRVPRDGSRIFVNKFIYRFRKPRRWEVIVFLYPFTCRECGWSGDVESVEGFRCPECGSRNLEAEHRNFIKRLVGLPNEDISILNGDLYVNGRIARKPPAIQERLWMHVFDSRFVPRHGPDPWDFGRNSKLWTQFPDGGLVLNALGSEEPVMAALAKKITATYAYNSGREMLLSRAHRLEGAQVGDCRVEVTVKLLTCRQPERAAALLRITEDGRDFELSIPVGRGRNVQVRDGQKVIREVPVEGLEPGERVRVVLENYDDRLVVKLRGNTIVTYDYEGDPSPLVRRKSVQFGAEGCNVAFQRMLIQRDIYYLNSSKDLAVPQVYHLDEDQYLVLGDNTPQSSDSRYWPKHYLPGENIIGQAFFAFWPIHYSRFLSLGAQQHGAAR